MEHNKNAKPEQWDSSWGLNRPSAALFTMRVGGWSVSVREPFQHHVLVVGTSAPTKSGYFTGERTGAGPEVRRGFTSPATCVRMGIH